jgi:hypothetical protein
VTKLLIALVLLGISFETAKANEVTLDSYLFSTQSLNEVRVDVVDEGYLLLERIVKEKSSSGFKVDKVTMDKILKVHLFLLKNDKTNYGPELLAPVFKANKDLFVKGVNAFSAEDKKLIEHRQQVFERMSRTGNG